MYISSRFVAMKTIFFSKPPNILAEAFLNILFGFGTSPSLDVAAAACRITDWSDETEEEIGDPQKIHFHDN